MLPQNHLINFVVLRHQKLVNRMIVSLAVIASICLGLADIGMAEEQSHTVLASDSFYLTLTPIVPDHPNHFQLVSCPAGNDRENTLVHFGSCFPVLWHDSEPVTFVAVHDPHHEPDMSRFLISSTVPFLGITATGALPALSHRMTSGKVAVIGTTITLALVILYSKIQDLVLDDDKDKFYRLVGAVGVPEFDEVPLTKDEKYQQLVKDLRNGKTHHHDQSHQGSSDDESKGEEQTAKISVVELDKPSLAISPRLAEQIAELWHTLSQLDTFQATHDTFSTICLFNHHCFSVR
ncbi:MAG: hypothetical protein OXC40_04430 [Proteobacteria bacterium]|nr:hypothetical protein [Pseudomonadota bacterium]